MSLVPGSIYSRPNASQSSLSQVGSSIGTGGGSLTGTRTPTASISTGPAPSTGSAVALFDSDMAKAEEVLEEILKEVADSKFKGSFVERLHAVAADRLLTHRKNHSGATKLERDLQENAPLLLEPIPGLGQATDDKDIDKIREYGKIFLQFKPMAAFICVATGATLSVLWWAFHISETAPEEDMELQRLGSTSPASSNGSDDEEV